MQRRSFAIEIEGRLARFWNGRAEVEQKSRRLEDRRNWSLPYLQIRCEIVDRRELFQVFVAPFYTDAHLAHHCI